MSKLKDEQEQKFISVYRSYVDEICQYVYLRSGLKQALAEDLTQDIFLDVYKSFSGFRGLCSERTWIYRITRNKLNDFYRKEYRPKFELVEMNEQLTEQIADPSQDIQMMMAKSFEQEKVRACLMNLSEQHRIVLTLKFVDQKSVKDIAFIVGKSPKAIESILQRAKNNFIRSYGKCTEKEDL